MASSTPPAAPPPIDPRFREFVCCCSTHIESLAKALLAIDVVTTGMSILMSFISFDMKSVPAGVIAICLSLMVLLKEHRPCLLVIIVFRGIAFAFGLLALFGLFLVQGLGRSKQVMRDLPPELKKTVDSIGVMIFIVALITFYIGWTFKVFLHYRRFLDDKAMGGSTMPVYYSTTAAPGTVPPPPGPAMYQPVYDATKVAATSHVAYPRDAPPAGGPSTAPPSAPPTYEEVEKSNGIGWKQ